MEEVLKIRKELEKTVPKNDFKRALELLRSLESIPMSLDVLHKTHIGLAVNKFRKSFDNPEISTLSKGMVKKWKKLLSSSSSSSSTTLNSANNGSSNNNNSISSSTSGGNNNNNNNNNINNNNNGPTSFNNNSSSSNSVNDYTTSQGSMSVATDMSGNPTSNQKSQAEHSQPPQQVATANNERVSNRPAPMQTEITNTNCPVREKCRQLLTDALKKTLPKELTLEPFLEEEVLAARIEECIYQEFRSTDMKYKNRLRSRVSNLGDVKNPYLRLNVLRGDIPPEKIAKMTAEEMASDELKREREKYTKEAINDHQMTLTSGTKTSEIKCPACKKYNVTYNQVQTRSADEPMTTFCYCNECGKRWKFC